MEKRILLEAIINEDNYKERVSRTEVFLGRTKKEQLEAQEILSNSTIGVAGTGGIGGAMALRLARFGVKCIKIADPDTFDISNINRQMGANIQNIGRNKAEVVGELVHQLAGDIEVEIYTDGITIDNAEEFVSDCDIVLDLLDFDVVNERFALHKAFRNDPETKHILTCAIVGWQVVMCKFEKNSMKIEEFYSDAMKETLSPKEALVNRIKLWSPKLPHFPAFQEILDWISENETIPSFTGAPPLAEGILTQRVILSLLDKEYPPYAKWLPPIPEMYIYNAATLEGEIVTSNNNFRNEKELEITWKKFDEGKNK